MDKLTFKEFLDFVQGSGDPEPEPPDAKYVSSVPPDASASYTPTAIFCMRHGRTPLDGVHRSDGWLDFPLSDEGRTSLIAAQQYLKDIPLTHIYCSPLKRTIETAEIINSGVVSGAKIVTDKSAMTWNLGTLMGTRKKPNKPIVTYFMNNVEEKPMGGESFAEFRNRFLPWLEERKKEAQAGKGPILLVLSGSNLREISKQLYDDTTILDLDEGGLMIMQADAGTGPSTGKGWQARVIFGIKDKDDEWLS